MKHDILDHLYDEAYPLALLAAEIQAKLDELEIYELALDLATFKYNMCSGNSTTPDHFYDLAKADLINNTNIGIGE